MIARSFWGAKADKGSADKRSGSGEEPPVDSLLDTRIDDDGSLSEPESAKPRARTTAGGPATLDDLDLAVQKLSEGLEAIERQGRAASAPAPEPESDDASDDESGAELGSERDFVAHSLDRLEARLEALSKRLQQRGGAPAGEGAPRPPATPSVQPTAIAAEAGEDDGVAAQLAESRRLAEAEEAAAEARRAEAEEAAARARKAEADARAAREAEASAEERRREAILAEARRHAEAIEARRQAEIAEARREAEIAEAKREAAEAQARRQADLAEARRRAQELDAERQAELADARRQAEAVEKRRIAEAEAAAKMLREQAEEAERHRIAEAETAAARLREQAEQAAEERRRMAAEAAEEHRRLAEEAEAIRLADLAEARRHAEAAEERRRADMEEARREMAAAEERRRAGMEEARRQAEAAAAQREAKLAAAIERRFAEVETQIDALSQGIDENQVEPVRAELLEIVKDMSELSRGGRAAGDALKEISARLDEMDVKLNAARNMAGNRLGDIQDKLGALGDRLDTVELEIPGFDAVRENQGAILERFDRMEGLVNDLASAEELIARVDGLKRQLQTHAQQREVARVEELVLKLAERLDALPQELSEEAVLSRIESALGAVATDLVEARRQRKSVAVAFDDQLAELGEKLREIGETGRTPDLSGIEKQLAEISGSLAEDRRTTGDALARLDRRLGVIAAQIEAQEDDTTEQVLAGLTEKMDALAAALAAQDAAGARRDIGGLDSKLDQIAGQIATQAERLSRQQIAPLETRLEEMQAQFAQIQKRSQDTSALFKPLVQKLHEISDRLAGLETMEESLSALANRPDPRGVHTQLEAILSRLEVLKGRSVDPAKMNELFDRIEFAIRTLPEPGGATIEGDSIPAERLARLEKKLDDIAATVARGGEAPEDIGELRADIASLRRELRSMPAAAQQEEPHLGDLMRAIAKRLERIPQEVPAALVSLEAQVERLTRALDDPESGVAGLASIQASLKTIEKRLDDTRRSLGYRPPRAVDDEANEAENEEVAGFARALAEEAPPELKSAAAPEKGSDKKSKDAIDAVQETLEAVVKRMAFLERDADAAAPRAALPPEPKPPEPASEPEPPAEPQSASAGGLLSRFTSRQLLRRATGGRAESFTPDSEEAEESSDLPLEPGTDSPLDSSLTGAPSSDTQFMSGARKMRTPRARAGAADAGEAPVIDDDFLAAARRAARAAAETGDGDLEDGEDIHPRPAGRSRSVGLIAAALIVVALVVAGGIVARTEVWPYPQLMAFIDGMRAPTAPAPVETAVAPAPPAPAPAEESTTQTSAAEPPPPAPVPPPMDLTAAPVAPPEAATPAMSAGELRPEEAQDTTAETPPVAAPATETASVAPAEVPAAPAATASATDATADLPEEIGPVKLRDAALAGDPVATFEVAARYAEGRGVLQDMSMAVRWYERSAEAGLAPAQYRLGSIYEKGLGVPRDLAKAQQWYGRAAGAGNVKAMHNLAVLFAEGAGGEPDLDRAAVLFRNAAEHGVRDSQFNLAILHARGLGVKQDLVEAYKWFAVAASSGDEEAAKRRDIIGQALPEGDRARAEQLAATFQPLPLVSEANEVQMPDWRAGDDATSVEVKSENELVALVQKLLAENGYDPGPPDGLLGEKTIEAISEFQGQAGLPKTGQIDNELVVALRNRST